MRDTPIDAVAVRHMLKVVAADVEVRSVTFLGEGWDNRLFLLNGETVIRVAKRAEDSVRLQTEARLLEVFAPLLPIPVPYPELIHEATEAFPLAAMGYRRIRGRSLREDDVSSRNVGRLADALAPFLSQLHAIPRAAVGQLTLPVFDAEAWLRRYIELVDIATPDLVAALGRDDVARFGAWWSDYCRDRTSSRFDPCIVHGDLACEHVLVDGNPLQVTGVIDFGDAMIADPALDIAGFPDLLAREILGLTSIGTDVEAVWKRRCVYRQLAPLHTVVEGHRNGDPRLIQTGIAQFQRRLSSTVFLSN